MKGSTRPPKPTGEIVDVSALGLNFTPSGKRSIYDQKLRELAGKDDPKFALRLPLSCKASIHSRAKKLRFKILCCEASDGKLYVKFAGVIEDPNVLKGQNWAMIRSVLATGTAVNTKQLASACRARGSDLVAAECEVILSQMKRGGEVTEDANSFWKLAKAKVA